MSARFSGVISAVPTVLASARSSSASVSSDSRGHSANSGAVCSWSASQRQNTCACGRGHVSKAGRSSGVGNRAWRSPRHAGSDECRAAGSAFRPPAAQNATQRNGILLKHADRDGVAICASVGGCVVPLTSASGDVFSICKRGVSAQRKFRGAEQHRDCVSVDCANCLAAVW